MIRGIPLARDNYGEMGMMSAREEERGETKLKRECGLDDRVVDGDGVYGVYAAYSNEGKGDILPNHAFTMDFRLDKRRFLQL